MSHHAKKLNVLCLHGFKQNARQLHQRTHALRKCLKSYVNFHYITAPHQIQTQTPLAPQRLPHRQPQRLSNAHDRAEQAQQQAQPLQQSPTTINAAGHAGGRAWWNASEDRTQYQGMQQSLCFVAQVLQNPNMHAIYHHHRNSSRHETETDTNTNTNIIGMDAVTLDMDMNVNMDMDMNMNITNFDGILGFSQGGCLALMLALLKQYPAMHADLDLDLDMDNHEFAASALSSLKFVWIFGGFLPRNDLFADCIYHGGGEGHANNTTTSTTTESGSESESDTECDYHSHSHGHYLAPPPNTNTAADDQRPRVVPQQRATNTSTLKVKIDSCSALIVNGTMDEYVSMDRAHEIAAIFDESKRTLLTHGGGHYVPAQKHMKREYIAFLEQFMH